MKLFSKRDKVFTRLKEARIYYHNTRFFVNKFLVSMAVDGDSVCYLDNRHCKLKRTKSCCVTSFRSGHVQVLISKKPDVHVHCFGADPLLLMPGGVEMLGHLGLTA